MTPSRLVAAFADLPDPRVARTRVHLLGEVLVMAILSVIAGADGWDEIVEWCEIREKWLRSFLALPAGVPCADTFRRIFAAIEPVKFAACFDTMIAELSGNMLDCKRPHRSAEIERELDTAVSHT